MSLFLVLGAFGCATGSGAATQAAKAWNQQEVTALAEQFTTASRSLYSTLYEDPNVPGMAEAEDTTASSVREIGETADALHGDLASGKGRDQTIGAVRRIKELMDDVKESSAFMDMPMDASRVSASVDGLFAQLNGYYGVE